MKIRWTLIACLTLMTGCGKEIPDDIIQPEQMEKVLYDYHLSIGMGQSSKNTEREAYKNYVFQKHKVTQAEFDSSMVWYTRESKELMSIYENLNRRFKREHDHLERLLSSRDESNLQTSVSGDTVDIWRKGDIHWLSEAPLNKHLIFEIKADTTFHERDAFLWNMNYHFLSGGKVVMGMNVVYENDSVIGETKLIDVSGPQSIYLHTDSAFKVKMLNGFIYVQEDSIQKPNILVHGMSLTRYHMPEPTDSISTDSVQVEKKEAPKEVKQAEKPKVEAPKAPKADSPAKDARHLRRPKQEKMIQLQERE